MSVPARRAPDLSGGTLHERPLLKPSPPGPIARAKKPAVAAARRGVHLRFWVFSAAVVSCLVIGMVSLNAMLVQTDYAIRSAQRQVTQGQADRDALLNEVAHLSSPARVASWARGHGMVAPKDAVILRIRGSSGASVGAGQ